MPIKPPRRSRAEPSRSRTPTARARPLYRNILVPTDGSALSEEAANAAVRFAGVVGGRLTALHVLPEIPAIELEAWARNDEKYFEHLEKAFEKRAEAHLAKVKRLADEAGVPCTTVFVHAASPASEIVLTARNFKCDLIFMGSHGAAADPLIGSVTAKVLARGTIPVLVHRAHAR